MPPKLRPALHARAAVPRGSWRSAPNRRSDTMPRSCSPRPSRRRRRSTLLARADAAAREQGSAVTSVTASYSDARRRTQIANSDGLLTGDDQVRTRIMVQCVATGDTGMQTAHEAPGRTMGFELFDSFTPEAVGRAAAQRALTLLDAVPAPSGRLPVVLKRGAGGVLFHEACGHGLEADHVLKDASVFKDQVGRAGRVAVRHPRRRRRLRPRVGDDRDRRRGTSGATQRAHRERDPHRLHVGRRARTQGRAARRAATAAARPIATCRCRA